MYRYQAATCKTAKNAWDKLENIYAGDSNVKEAKLQIYRAKFEQLRMKNIATLLHTSNMLMK